MLPSVAGESNRYLAACVFPFVATAAAVSLTLNALYNRISGCVKYALSHLCRGLFVLYTEIRKAVSQLMASTNPSIQDVPKVAATGVSGVASLMTATSCAALAETTLNCVANSACVGCLTTPLGIACAVARTAYLPFELACHLFSHIISLMQAGGMEAVKAVYHLNSSLSKALKPLSEVIFLKLTTCSKYIQVGVVETMKGAVHLYEGASTVASLLKKFFYSLLSDLTALVSSGAHEVAKVAHTLPQWLQQAINLPAKPFIAFLTALFGLVQCALVETAKGASCFFSHLLPQALQIVMEPFCHFFSPILEGGAAFVAQTKQAIATTIEGFDRGTLFLRQLAKSIVSEVMGRGCEAAHEIPKGIVAGAEVAKAGAMFAGACGKQALVEIVDLFVLGSYQALKAVGALLSGFRLALEPPTRLLTTFVRTVYELLKAMQGVMGHLLFEAVQLLFSLGRMGKLFLCSLIRHLGHFFGGAYRESVRIYCHIRYRAWTFFKAELLYRFEGIVIGQRHSIWEAYRKAEQDLKDRLANTI